VAYLAARFCFIPHNPVNGMIFQKNAAEHKTGVLIFFNSFI
jgi:hypothetical protein